MQKLLSELNPNEVGIITKINLDENQYFRLLNLVFQPKMKIKCCFKSPFGDPIAYQVKGTILAIRCEMAKNIEVEVYE